jgi:glycosyltransferase involved in cell wall biosynthesis
MMLRMVAVPPTAPRRISLVVTTYEWPDALGLVLASVARQTRLPDEVIVADDGSGAATAALLETWRERLAGRLHHVWQPNEGFRAARVRNLGLAIATGDYVIVLDGDMVLHPEFVADHAAAARPGQWVQGVRPRLSRARTERMLAGRGVDPTTGLGAGDAADLRWWQPGLEHRFHALRSDWLARHASRRRPKLASVKSCNQGYWREDLVRVNGFDERFVGWGPEDKELAARLGHAGVECLYLKHAAVAFHLWHPTRAPAAGVNPNDRLLETTIATRATRCELGLDLHDVPARPRASRLA